MRRSGRLRGRNGLRRPARVERRAALRRKTPLRRTPISPASEAQRAKALYGSLCTLPVSDDATGRTRDCCLRVPGAVSRAHALAAALVENQERAVPSPLALDEVHGHRAAGVGDRVRSAQMEHRGHVTLGGHRNRAGGTGEQSSSTRSTPYAAAEHPRDRLPERHQEPCDIRARVSGGFRRTRGVRPTPARPETLAPAGLRQFGLGCRK
jgi:hypothetical protein